MQLKLLLPALLLSTPHLLSARTWTSADGTKTFEADYISHDEAKKTVTIKIEGEERSFDLINFSKADHDYVKDQANPPHLDELLAKAALHRLQDGQFKPARVEKKPEYYLVYFSASW